LLGIWQINYYDLQTMKKRKKKKSRRSRLYDYEKEEKRQLEEYCFHLGIMNWDTGPLLVKQ